MIHYDYSLIRLVADKVRSEVINVGLAVFKENGYVETFMLQDRTKLRAISNNIEIEDLNKFGFTLSEFSLKLNKEDLLSFFSRGHIYLQGGGYFSIEYEKQYENKIADLMSRIVNPPTVLKKIQPRPPKMLTELKEIFRQYPNLLSDDLADIDNHKIVLNYPIKADLGLKADLLLKNSIYHLTETIDFSIHDIKKNLERSALKALTITEADQQFRKEGLHSFIVYSLKHKNEQNYIQHLNLLSNYASDLINLESNEDKSRYVEHILKASGYSF